MTTRQLRRRKDAPVSHVPTILDEIVVCWELNGSTVWWPATVLEVFEYDEPIKDDHFGKGTLMYKQFNIYPTEEADVQFFYTKRKGNLVCQHYNGKTLQMTWKPSETQEIEVGKTAPLSTRLAESPQRSTPSKRRADSVTRKSKRSSLSKDKIEPSLASNGANSSAPNGVDSFLKSPRTAVDLNNAKKDQASRSAARTGSCSTDPTNASPHAHTTDREGTSEYRAPVDVGVVQAAVLQKTTSQFLETILTTSQKLMNNFASTSFHDQMAQLVMHELRIDLVNELHRHFRSPHAVQKVSSGLQQRSLRTSVSCPLHTFSNLARKIQEGSSDESVHFFPGFSDTQNPSISTERLTIYFASIHSLSSAMGFNDNRDFETICSSGENAATTHTMGANDPRVVVLL